MDMGIGLLHVKRNTRHMSRTGLYDCHIFTSPPIGGGRGIVMPMSVCVFVCLFVCVFVCLCVCLSVFSQNFKV